MIMLHLIKVTKAVVVNDDVFIGSRSMLMPNIRIAGASVIGSCSLLTSGKEFQG